MGDVSQVDAELILFKHVVESKHKYDYIHLISGVDLPIKSQDYIHDFFNSQKVGTNFIGYAKGKINEEDLERRKNNYYLFTNHLKPRKNTLVHKLEYAAFKIIRDFYLWFQNISGIKRSLSEKTIKKGCNWVSITQDLCTYLVENENRIKKLIKGMPCADEIFIQTMVFNSEFKTTIYDLNKDFAIGTRLIDWKRGWPYTFRKDDYMQLINSNCLFARKFSSDIDKEIILEIYRHLNKR